jgi:hypothetical protein
VHPSDFAFTPEQLHMHLDSAMLLHIVNESGGGHDVDAPELFAASVFPGSPPPDDGNVEIARTSCSGPTRWEEPNGRMHSFPA